MQFFTSAVDCGTLNNPANGQVSYTGRTTFGQTATYSCDAGYNLVGNSIRTCQATGVWSGSAPTCQGKLLLKLEYNVLSETIPQKALKTNVYTPTKHLLLKHRSTHAILMKLL